MSRDPLSLTLSIDGPLVADHRLPLSELARISDRLRVALRDVAIVLSDQGPSGRGGRTKKFIEDSTDLRVVGSPRAGSFCLELEIPPPSPEPQEPLTEDLGAHLAEHAVETLVTGLAELRDDDHLPSGFDRGVLRTVVGFQGAFRKGITAIDLKVEGTEPLVARIDRQKVKTARRLIERPLRAQAVAEGVLQMVDFTRLECRIDRPPLPSVVCFFNERDRDRVQELVRKFVRVIGEGEFPPGEDQPTKITVEKIKLLYETLDFDSEAFWQRRRLGELADEQEARSFAVPKDLDDDEWRDDDAAAALIAAIRDGL